MRWSDATAPPSEKILRQFAALFLLVFLAMAAWRGWHGRADAAAIAALAVTVGVLGLVRPSAIRWIFTGWMVVAFPIGWTVSRLALGAVFYGVFTPVGAFLRAKRRDLLRLKRANPPTYWTAKPQPENVASYYRQS